jgi:predicted PhzF superfamily epimerase YddE/YHI9
MSFPKRQGEPINVNDIPDFVIQALGGVKPIAATKARDLILVYENEEDIKATQPDLNTLKALPEWCCVTAQSKDKDIDFISRFFCADDSLGEDPVTGSTHCTLTPYWAEKLGKSKLKAYQASARGGYLDLELKNNRVLITGQVTPYLKGKITF